MENGRPPDPADWAVMDVVNYFRTVGFEEQASAFQEQNFLMTLQTSQQFSTKTSGVTLACCDKIAQLHGIHPILKMPRTANRTGKWNQTSEPAQPESALKLRLHNLCGKCPAVA
ncbi:sterile alpha motif domain-containing protein 13 isoform X9 [Macaca mulatta]